MGSYSLWCFQTGFLHLAIYSQGSSTSPHSLITHSLLAVIAVPRSGCTYLLTYKVFNSHQQWMGVPAAPHHCQHFILSAFRILAILIGVVGSLPFKIRKAWKAKNRTFSIKSPDMDTIVKVYQLFFRTFFSANTGSPHFIMPCRYCVFCLCFYRSEGLWQPCLEQVCWHHFVNICSLCISMSHFLTILQTFSSLYLLWRSVMLTL